MKKEQNSRGTALLIAVVIVVILIALTASISVFSSFHSTTLKQNFQSVNAKYAVKAGLSSAVIALNKNPDVVELQGNSAQWDSVIVKFSTGEWKQLSNDLGEIESTNAKKIFANINISLKQRSSLIFKTFISQQGGMYLAKSYSCFGSLGHGILGYIAPKKNIAGVFGDQKVEFINVGIDSYDSSKESYNENNFHQKGHISSNGPILISGDAKIYGDAYPGEEDTVDNPEKVEGTVKPNSEFIEYSPVDTQWLQSSSVDFPKLKANEKLFLSENEYNYTDINFSNGEVVIDDTVTIYCHGDFSCAGQGAIKINPDARLILYVAGKIQFTGKFVAFEYIPFNFQIYSTLVSQGGAPNNGAGNWGVKISGNTAVAAYVYAPRAYVYIGGNSDFYGAVIGYSLRVSGSTALNNNNKFHYDESMAKENTANALIIQARQKIPFVDSP